MPRIAGQNIPDKRLEVALTYLYGIGRPKANAILKQAKIDQNRRASDLAEPEVNTLKGIIEKMTVEGDLRRENMMNIKRLKEINSYRGMRHSRGLPARGQRTKTNSRTVRGNIRKTAGSGRRPAAQKT